MILDSCPSVRYRQAPLFSYEFKNRCDESSLLVEWEALFRGAYTSDSEFMDQTFRRRTGEYPTFAKKHATPPVLLVKFDRHQHLVPRILELFPTLQMLSVVRHPCGAMHSWFTAKEEFPPATDPREHWRTGAIKKVGPGDHFGFDDWKAMTRDHLAIERMQPNRFRVVRYERFAQNPEAETRAAFAFLNLEMTDQTKDFLVASRGRHDHSDYAVFKDPSVVDRWRTEMIPEIRDAILSELRSTDLAGILDE